MLSAVVSAAPVVPGFTAAAAARESATTPPAGSAPAGAGLVAGPSALTPAPVPPEGVAAPLPPPPAQELPAPPPPPVQDPVRAGVPSLRVTDDPEWPVMSDGNLVIVRFGNDASRLVQLSMPGGRAILSARTRLKIGTPRIDGMSVIFDDVARDTDLRFDVGEYGVTQRLILKSPKAPRELSLFVSDPDGALLGMTNAGGGAYSLGSGDQTRLEVTPAYAYEHVPDAVGIRHQPGSAHQSVVAEDGGYVVRSWIDEEWLADHEFPIELDPDYVVAVPGTTTGGRFTAMNMARFLDTRNGIGGSPDAIPAQEGYPLKIAGRGGIPSTGVAAVSIHISPVNPLSAGRVSVYPSGATPTLASHVQFSFGGASML
jgi:hypothetical protein